MTRKHANPDYSRRHAAGLVAAFGERHRLAATLRTESARRLRQFDHFVQRDRPGDYLEFIPASTDPAVLADLAARINWFLGDRQIAIYMEGAHGVPYGPEDAPHMDPTLVHDPGWEAERPRGRPELVIHDLTPGTAVRHVISRRQSAIVSPWFAWEAEKGWWFELQRRHGTARPPDPAASAERLFSRLECQETAFVLGTGPSATTVDLESLDAEIRITCNSTVRNRELLERLQPDVIAFADPIFHCGPSRYAAQFRRDLISAVELTGAVPISIDHWISPVLAHHPEIRDRVSVVSLDDASSAAWRWPTRDDFSVRTTSNVLTLLMLPAALALADRIEVAGCDGRAPNENYFWKHNPAIQYSDEMMQSVFTAHPGFFRERDYGESFDEHSDELELLVSMAEREGKTVKAVTPSFIPALRARAAANIAA